MVGRRRDAYKSRTQLSSDVPWPYIVALTRIGTATLQGYPAKDATLMVLSRNRDGNTTEIIAAIKRSIGFSIPA